MIPNALQALRAGLPAAIEGAVSEVCSRIRDDGAELCPVQSGALKASIRAETFADGGGASGIVSAGAPYAAAVELGTWAQPPKPYLEPAFALHSGELAAELASAVRALI